MNASSPTINRGLKVLIIDDNPAVRQALELLLEKTGDQAFSAPDGYRGLALAESNPFDLIFLDVDMPDLDGFEVGSALRRIPRTASTALVFISGTANAQRREKARQLQALDYLQKPFGLEIIHAIVSRLKQA